MRKCCEYCKDEIKEKYGTGRFCNASCARGYSTSLNREEINEKRSKALKGKKYPERKGIFHGKRGEGFKKGHSLSEESRQKIWGKSWNGSWEECSLAEKKRRVFKEQSGKCRKCGISDWMGEPLTLEFEHINGNHSDNSRDNVEYLCLNCHSQTPTFRNKKRNS